VFHRFGEAKIRNGGSVLGSSQFLLLPQLSQKNDAYFKSGQIIISLRYFKSVTHSVGL